MKKRNLQNILHRHEVKQPQTLMLYAKRKLKELQKYAVDISYDRTFEPNLNVTDKVELRYPASGIEGIYTVTSQKISLDHCGTTAEEVTA